jgi:hypothetical protein
MGFDDRAADREAHAHPVGLRRVEGFKETRQALRAQPRAGIPHRDAHAPRLDTRGADVQFAVAVLTPLIDWMALTIKFNITCCSCTRSHWMRGNSPASCVPTVTPVLSASLRVRAVTSRIAALRSTTSFRGGAFLMRDPIRSTTSPARSASFTMQVSASLASATSGELLPKNRSAAAALLRAAAMGCLIS